MVIGNGRKYLTALVAINASQAASLERNGHALEEWLSTEFSKRERKLGENRRIKRFAILPSPFSVENGELTTTLKLRRALIENKYRELIDQLYEDA